MARLTRRTFCAAAAPAFAAPPRRSPNVVLILCDDLGYGDLGCYGSSIKTPHLDGLAAHGARLDSYISASPVCSPSRAGLLTGRYPTRTGVPRVLFPQDKDGLAPDETTLAAALKEKKYRTACIGKWHLGHTPPYLPTARGFDSYFGIPYSNDMTPPVVMRNGDVAETAADMATITSRYTEEAVQFVEQSGDHPFFLYLAHTMPHIPLGASKRFAGKSPAGPYGDVVEEIDWSTGQLLAALDRQGVREDTLVLFTSDNGPWYQGSAGRLRGRKGSTFEGGLRVPFLARLPGRIRAGTRSSAAASALDVFPTIAEVTGCKSSKPLDGESLWPVLAKAGAALPRKQPLLYFNDWDLQCARQGQWKLHIARHNVDAYNPAPQAGRLNLPLARPELYDVQADPDESFDLAAAHPAAVSEILAAVETLMTGFPDVVRQRWAETRDRQVRPTPAGAWPRP